MGIGRPPKEANVSDDSASIADFNGGGPINSPPIQFSELPSISESFWDVASVAILDVVVVAARTAVRLLDTGFFPLRLTPCFSSSAFDLAGVVVALVIRFSGVNGVSTAGKSELSLDSDRPPATTEAAVVAAAEAATEEADAEAAPVL